MAWRLTLVLDVENGLIDEVQYEIRRVGSMRRDSNVEFGYSCGLLVGNNHYGSGGVIGLIASQIEWA